MVFPGGSDGKASACNAGDLGSIPGQGRSPGERNSNPLQYSCLENSTDRGAWQATVHWVAKSRTRLSYFSFFFSGPYQDFPDSSVGKESACNAGDPSSTPGLGRSSGKVIGYPLQYSWAFLTNIAQGFSFLHILANICYFLSFYNNHSNIYEVISLWF